MLQKETDFMNSQETNSVYTFKKRPDVCFVQKRPTCISFRRDLCIGMAKKTYVLEWQKRPTRLECKSDVLRISQNR